MITKDRSNWMHEHRDILNDKFLASICLPGNHDSPTAKLQNIATDERRKDDRLLNLNKIPFGLAEHGYIAAKLMATATTKDIATQLNDGLRAFDFRVFEQMFDESYVIAPGGP
ncbi:hypothetical protein [Methylomonas albis]|uniref:Uncharacterized protein n=1 Tax=Methylomonas albis TaxID=1854563 RepID=A0ABR9D935_9GAMM|nr:hypothetical protein [Methylomonas albis]MBD9358719.1 hypothetical protein [Methylomonas albis]CAD6882168.1 hypothetical protein [Methylomonas albis]